MSSLFLFFSVNSSCFGGLLPAEDVLCHIENLHLRELRAIDLGNLDSFLCSYPFLQTDSLSKLVCTGQSVHCVHLYIQYEKITNVKTEVTRQKRKCEKSEKGKGGMSITNMFN